MKKSQKSPQHIIAITIIIIGIGAVGYIVWYMTGFSKYNEGFQKQQEVMKQSSEQMQKDNEKLTKQTQCLMDLLRYKTDYQKAHQPMTSSQAEELQQTITTKQAECEKLQ
jgi:hypothetical protein